MIRFVEIGSEEAKARPEKASCEDVLRLFSENPSLAKNMECKKILGKLVYFQGGLSGVMYNEYEFIRFCDRKKSWGFDFPPTVKVATRDCLDWLKQDGHIWAVYSDKGAV